MNGANRSNEHDAFGVDFDDRSDVEGVAPDSHVPRFHLQRSSIPPTKPEELDELFTDWVCEYSTRKGFRLGE